VTINDLSQRNINLIYRLRGLGMTGAILHIGAHPDDEDIGLLSYMSHKFGVRAVYWSATRGEGGQNRIGPYKGEALGIYRTWESLASRALDGGESLYGPFFDFGYSKNAEEGLSKWGREEMVKQIVRAIRMVQPQIIVSRWKGISDDFHGHHQAVGKATYEAFDAAGDPDRFPELEKQGLVPWQPRKFYHSENNSGGDLKAGGAVNILGRINPDLERDGILRINTGEFDPFAGCTYQEQAWLAYNKNQTQSMGLAPKPGDFFYYFSLYKSLVAVPDRETEIFDGLDPTLTGLADYPGNGPPSLRRKLDKIKDRVNQAILEFRADNPISASKPLLESLTILREIKSSLENKGLDGSVQKTLDLYLERKIKNFEEVTVQCLGLRLECLMDTSRITPGQPFRLSSKLWNHQNINIDRVIFNIGSPGDWKIRSIQDNQSGGVSDELIADHEVISSKTAELSSPYWLEKPHELYRYQWPDGEPAGRPFGPPLVHAECEVILDGDKILLRQPAVFREKFSGGYRELPLAVIPPISLHPKEMKEFFRISTSEQLLELQVTARSNVESKVVKGNLKLEAPAGWRVKPESVDLSFEKFGDTASVSFSVKIPKNTSPDQYLLRYMVLVGNRYYDAILNPVRKGTPGLPGQPDATNCLQEEYITVPAAVKVCLFDLELIQKQNYAYVKGAEEEILKALSHFNLGFHLINDEEMGYIDLGRFDAVVIGPNAYLVRDKLRKNALRFLEYVKHGGTLIVQYQGYAFEGKGYAPYPFRFAQPHDRVTNENAPVTMLKPDHTIFNFPNTIRQDDFNGWFKDRGLYFFNQWDKRYDPMLECNDPGEDPNKGGLLVAGYGRGTYLYTGYSFFNQLPAGVPGAFRLFANILALPEARVLERIDFLKNISLFSTLKKEHLDSVARIMFEQWVENGNYICRQGEEGNELYIVKKGMIEVIQKSNSKEHVIFTAKEGDCLGELAVLGDMTRTASLCALGDVQLLVIKGEHFLALLKKYPDMSIQMLGLMVERVLNAERRSKNEAHSA
jgi:LmbE family N-acetylglucosaminyl deacetylase